MFGKTTTPLSGTSGNVTFSAMQIPSFRKKAGMLVPAPPNYPLFAFRVRFGLTFNFGSWLYKTSSLVTVQIVLPPTEGTSNITLRMIRSSIDLKPRAPVLR